MILLALAAAIPGVFWDGAPDTAPALRDAGVQRIFVSAAQAAAWKGIPGLEVATADLAKATKLRTPAVNYRYDQASASRAPWLDSNGWRFLRLPQARFYYDAAGPGAALAAAEAFAWRADALVKTDAPGLAPLAQMLAFARGLETPAGLQPVADFGFIDDGAAITGEVMNLLVRDNLLFRLVRAPDPTLKLTVKIGDKAYPIDKAKNPGVMAHLIRADLNDDRRSLRIYGTAVVVARLEAAPERLRVHVLNYDTARKVEGLRVRVPGEFPKHHVAAAGSPDAGLIDYAAGSGATEFTLPELKTYAVIDLMK